MDPLLPPQLSQPANTPAATCSWVAFVPRARPAAVSVTNPSQKLAVAATARKHPDPVLAPQSIGPWRALPSTLVHRKSQPRTSQARVQSTVSMDEVSMT